jgi:pimeloyl-ACP methyl ester carboxylesterase
LALSGWYIPPRNGAVIILLHSYYGDRRQTLPVAEMLYKHGYGLLLYDQRASGESAGALRSLGALDIPDLGQAAAWLAAHQQNLKIGAYGCSMGGAIALAGAVKTASIQAVAADAPSPLSWAENAPAFSLRDPLSLPVMALYYRLVQLRTGALPLAGTLETTRNYGDRPLLLISSGTGAESARVTGYFQAAMGSKNHWNIPEAGHCGGPAARPAEYEQHLANFFDTSLLKNK